MPSVKALRTASAALIVAGGAWILYTFPPTQTAFYPPCVFHKLTGLNCPGCGTTRALHQLLHGHIGAAFRLNPMLFALLVTALFAAPNLMRGQAPQFLMKPWFGWTCVIVVSAWWVGRNLAGI